MILPLFGIKAIPYRHSKPVRDDHYRAFIRRFPCVACGTERRLRDAMHIGPHGIGQKACDLQTVPGCRQCHRELHKIGRPGFERKYNLDLAGLIEMFHSFYRIEHTKRAAVLIPKEEKEAA